MKILFKLTSRSRPEKFKETLENIIDNVSEDCEYKILCTVDSDDHTLTGFVTFVDSPYILHSGVSKNKIDAINRDMDKSGDWDILVNMSDDMRFIQKGFDKVIVDSFAGDTDLCLHLPDGNQNEKLITLAILGRKYYERFNYIYHPSYISLWCDMEMTDVAKNLGKYKYVPQLVYRHLHPAWGLAPMDDQYIKTESFESVDKQNYLTRKANGFT